MGGYVALEYLRQYAPGVEGVVLANTKPQADDQVAIANRLAMAEMVLKEGVSSIAESMPKNLLSTQSVVSEAQLLTTQMIENSSIHAIASAQRAMAQRQDSCDMLPHIQLPVLAIAGDSDPLATVEQTQAWATTIPNSTMAVVPNSGHLTPLENAEAFNNHFDQWHRATISSDA